MPDNPGQQVPIPVSVDTYGHLNGLSYVFGVLAIALLTISAVKGFIPIFLIIGIAFGCGAYFLYSRSPLKDAVLTSVVASAIILAGVAGAAMDQDLFEHSYRYLSQGDKQLRVDERSGRTDQLLPGAGWLPIAYDSPPINLGAAAIWRVALSDGEWGAGLPPTVFGKMCFTVENRSRWVIGKLDLTIKTGSGKAVSNATTSEGFPIFDAPISLRPDGVTLDGPGMDVRFCGLPSRNLDAGETWSYSVAAVYGWK